MKIFVLLILFYSKLLAILKSATLKLFIKMEIFFESKNLLTICIKF